MKKMNKKGFSIVEVVITMTVIAIVSATALTIVTTSFDNTRAAMYKADAQYIVYDALECFKATSNLEEFDAAFSFRGNLEPASEHKKPMGQGAVMLTYKISDSQYTVEAFLIYNAVFSGSAMSADIFNIAVYDTDGQKIASTSYRRPCDYNVGVGA